MLERHLPSGCCTATNNPVSPTGDTKRSRLYLLKVAKAPLEKQHQRKVRNEWRQYRRQKHGEINPEPFTVAELNTALRCVKQGKAAGYDNILPELILNLGQKARVWLTKF